MSLSASRRFASPGHSPIMAPATLVLAVWICLFVCALGLCRCAQHADRAAQRHSTGV